MKKHLLILFSIVLLFLNSCKKDVGYLTNGVPGTTGSGDTYLPITKGTTWTYVDGTTSTANSSTGYMTGGTTIFNNKTYYNLSSTSTTGVDQSYFYVGNHLYTTRAVVTNGGTTATEDIPFLNDALPVGSTFTSKISDDGLVNGIPSQAIVTIKEIGITKSVLGQTFSNIIHSQVNLQFDYGLGTGFTTLVAYDFYVAKNIGIVETDATVNFFGYTLTTNSYLKSYTIK